MGLELRQIFLPNPNTNNTYVTYENKLQPCMRFGGSILKELYMQNEEEIIKDVIYKINDYLSSEDLCNEEEDMFPRRCEITGEWYIGDISFVNNREYYWLSIMVCFLGLHPDLNARMYVDDYLGLEVCFIYDKEQSKFVFDEVNSSCI